jgi:hypothetical protein
VALPVSLRSFDCASRDEAARGLVQDDNFIRMDGFCSKNLSKTFRVAFRFERRETGNGKNKYVIQGSLHSDAR